VLDTFRTKPLGSTKRQVGKVIYAGRNLFKGRDLESLVKVS